MESHHQTIAEPPLLLATSSKDTNKLISKTLGRPLSKISSRDLAQMQQWYNQVNTPFYVSQGQIPKWLAIRHCPKFRVEDIAFVRWNEAMLKKLTFLHLRPTILGDVVFQCVEGQARERLKQAATWPRQGKDLKLVMHFLKKWYGDDFPY